MQSDYIIILRPEKVAHALELKIFSSLGCYFLTTRGLIESGPRVDSATGLSTGWLKSAVAPERRIPPSGVPTPVKAWVTLFKPRVCATL